MDYRFEKIGVNREVVFYKQKVDVEFGLGVIWGAVGVAFHVDNSFRIFTAGWPVDCGDIETEGGVFACDGGFRSGFWEDFRIVFFILFGWELIYSSDICQTIWGTSTLKHLLIRLLWDYLWWIFVLYFVCDLCQNHFVKASKLITSPKIGVADFDGFTHLIFLGSTVQNHVLYS